MNRKLKMGMIGGGIGSFIGDVHRKAASIDGLIELVCGAFSSDETKSVESGKNLFLPENRCYKSFEEMILKEKALPEVNGDFFDMASTLSEHQREVQACCPNGSHTSTGRVTEAKGSPAG